MTWSHTVRADLWSFNPVLVYSSSRKKLRIMTVLRYEQELTLQDAANENHLNSCNLINQPAGVTSCASCKDT